jgi:uncharacterized protein (TIGR04255 family)
MRLPIEITPNPVVISTVELRFNGEKSSEEILMLISDSFRGELPFLSKTGIPNELKSNPQFSHAADYSLSSDTLKMSFSDKVLSFENLVEYPLWLNYSTSVYKNLHRFFELVPIDTVTRIGVRFGSVLQGFESFQEVLMVKPSLQVKDFEEVLLENMTSHFKSDDLWLRLHISNSVRVNKPGVDITGVFIDIDASYSNHVASKEDREVIIERLHTAQKTLFFSILSEECLKKLNPRYS